MRGFCWALQEERWEKAEAERKKRREMENETIESIAKWADETFGPCSIDTAYDRARDEMMEYLQAVSDEEILTEAADVCITLYRLPGIREAINKKMAVNRKRKWKVEGGVGQHIN